MMKSAKEMFEELGYEELFIPYDYHKEYKDGRELFISFDTNKKTVTKGKCGFKVEPMELKDITITKIELQAINKQVEELKWNIR